LDKHLRSKAKRYKLQNNVSKQLPTTPILESLLDPESIGKVQRYADWMNKHPAKTFGHQIEQTSQADELRKTWKMKEEAEKKFGLGKTPPDWSLFDIRSGKPR
jgi:hypothetical protein